MIAIILGTKAELIKTMPLMKELDKRKIDPITKAIKENFKELNVKTPGEKIVAVPKTETDIRTLQKIKEKIFLLID